MKGQEVTVFLIKMTAGIPFYLKIRPTCVFNGSFSINDVAIFGSVIDKQYDRLSDLISFSTAKNQITFYRRKYWNTKYINYLYLCLHICKIW